MIFRVHSKITILCLNMIEHFQFSHCKKNISLKVNKLSFNPILIQHTKNIEEISLNIYKPILICSFPNNKVLFF